MRAWYHGVRGAPWSRPRRGLDGVRAGLDVVRVGVVTGCRVPLYYCPSSSPLAYRMRGPPRTSTRHVGAPPQTHGVLDRHGPLLSAPHALHVKEGAVPIVHGGSALHTQSNECLQRAVHNIHNGLALEGVAAHAAHPTGIPERERTATTKQSWCSDSSMSTMAHKQKAARVINDMCRTGIMGNAPPSCEAA